MSGFSGVMLPARRLGKANSAWSQRCREATEREEGEERERAGGGGGGGGERIGGGWGGRG